MARWVIQLASLSIYLFASATPAQEPPAAPVAQLQSGTTVIRDISGKAFDSYSIALTSGQCAELVVEQRGIDVVVQVVDAQKKVVAEFDADLRPQGEERVVVTAAEDATYEIRVKPRYSRAPAGSYEIRVVAIRAKTESDSELFTAHRLATEAASLREAGKYDDAVKRAEEAVAHGEKAVGDKDPYFGLLESQLAYLYWLKGDFGKSQPIAERGIAIARDDPHPNEPQIAVAMDSLALDYRSTDQAPQAEDTLKQILAIQL